MPRLTQKLAGRATTTVTETVKLKTNVRAMLVERFAEYAKLSTALKELKGTKKKPGRMRRIQDEVAELFRREKQGKALLKGCDIDGFKVKMVGGKRSVFDKLGFMEKHGLTEEDFAEFTETVDNEPYVRITAPGEDDDE